MNAKRSTQDALWTGPGDASVSQAIPAGAVLANEFVFHQLAFEAQAWSIMRAGRTAHEQIEEDRAQIR